MPYNPHPLAYAAKKLKKVVGMEDDESTAAAPQVGRKAGDGWPPLVNKAKKVIKDVMTADTQYGKIRKAQLAAKDENPVEMRKRKQKTEAERIVRGQPGRTKSTE
jgi:hypothetical protein